MKSYRWNYYTVWRRIMADELCRPGEWLCTSHIIKARTAKEANSKMRRMFAGACFHSMSLVALLSGESPSRRLDHERITSPDR